MRSRLSLTVLVAIVTPLAAQEPGAQDPRTVGPSVTAAEPKVLMLREGPTIPPETVATIRLTPAGDTINPGDCRKFTAMAYDATHRALAISGFTFSISDATRLKVDPPSGEVCAGTNWSREPTAAFVTASLPNSSVTGNASLMIRAQPIPPRRQGPAVAAPAPQPSFTTKP